MKINKDPVGFILLTVILCVIVSALSFDYACWLLK